MKLSSLLKKKSRLYRNTKYCDVKNKIGKVTEFMTQVWWDYLEKTKITEKQIKLILIFHIQLQII